MAKSDPYAGYSQNKNAGAAYQAYLATGRFFDVWGVQHDLGGPPPQPMTENEFYTTIQKAKKPAGYAAPFSEEWKVKQWEAQRKAANEKWASREQLSALSRRMTGEAAE